MKRGETAAYLAGRIKKERPLVFAGVPKPRQLAEGGIVGAGFEPRVQPEMGKQLDDWRRKQDEPPGRPEAIRRS